MRDTEIDYNNIESNKQVIENVKHEKLTEKIRSNKEIAYFIKEVFDNDKKNKAEYKNIEIDFLGANSNLREYINYLEVISWTYLPITSSIYNTSYFVKYYLLKTELNIHRYIGT